MRKGTITRTRILSTATALASEVGLEALSIGALAERIGLSKSGLFAHFGSKEELQVATVREVQARFAAAVYEPALAAPRGLPRLRAVFDRWLEWPRSDDQPGGCVLLAAAAEYDDQPGAVRHVLVAGQQALREALERTIALAIEERHLRGDTDAAQFAFELFGIVTATHHDRRLLRAPDALARARRAFERLVADHLPPPQEPA
jgi:AcrR family transcriptional regulator